MHWVAHPSDGVPRITYGVNEAWQRLGNICSSHATDECQTPRLSCGVQFVAECNDLFGGIFVIDLATNWIPDTLKKFHVGVVNLLCSGADPRHMRGAVVPTVAVRRVLSG